MAGVRVIKASEVKKLPVGAKVDMRFPKSGTVRKCVIDMVGRYKVLRWTDEVLGKQMCPITDYTQSVYEVKQ